MVHPNFHPEFEIQATTEKICQELCSLGYKQRINRNRKNYVTFTNEDLGVKVSIEECYSPPYKPFARGKIQNDHRIGEFSLTMKIVVKSSSDTWIIPPRKQPKQLYLGWAVPHVVDVSEITEKEIKLHKKFKFSSWLEPNERDIASVIRQLRDYVGAKDRLKKSRENLYPPIEIGPGFIFEQEDGSISMINMFWNAKVLGFATIDDDLTINQEEIYKPDGDTWFYIDVKTANGNPRVIVKEGPDNRLQFYPVKRSGKRYKIDDAKPRSSKIDYNDATELDGKLFGRAISRFLKNL